MKSTRSLQIILLTTLMLFASFCLAGSATNTSGETIVLDDYMGLLVTVQVSVGEHTKRFFLDTGGGLTVITPELVDDLGLEQYGQVTGFRMNGERLDLARCDKTELQIGSKILRVEPSVFDIMGFLPEGMPEVGGLVSLHTFQDQIITLNLAAATLVLETAASLKQVTESMSPLNIRFSRQAAGAGIDMMVEVKAKTGSLWLEVDTGNVGPVLLAPHALIQLGLIDDRSSDPWSGKVALDVIGLGELEVTAAQADLICDGVLNIKTLKRMALTIDLPNVRAWARVHENQP